LYKGKGVAEQYLSCKSGVLPAPRPINLAPSYQTKRQHTEGRGVNQTDQKSPGGSRGGLRHARAALRWHLKLVDGQNVRVTIENTAKEGAAAASPGMIKRKASRPR